jgi:hypothetical protein
MTHRYYNPFAGIDIIAPAEQRAAYDRYCQTAGRAIIDQSPFPRMIDFWFAGLSIGARKGLEPRDLSKQDTFKFIDGTIFDSDSWRVQAVMLIAIAVTDTVEIVGEPRRMMTIANGLAAVGVPYVVEMLCQGDQNPIWNISEALDEILRKNKA